MDTPTIQTTVETQTDESIFWSFLNVVPGKVGTDHEALALRVSSLLQGGTTETQVRELLTLEGFRRDTITTALYAAVLV